MYDELAATLRRQCAEMDCGNCNTCVKRQAADAIEKLSEYVRQIEELRKDGYYLQKTKMSAYGQAIMTMPLPPAPEEET